MKLQLVENIGRDIWNWQNSVMAESYGVSWKKFLPSDVSVEKVRDSEYLRNYLEKKFYQSGKVSEFKSWVEHTLNFSQLQKDLEGLMNRKFSFKEVKVFITTFHRAPYDVEQGFFYLIWRDSNKEKTVTNIYHELMHFLFHIYYWETCKKANLSDTQIHILKESSTILLNPILEKRGLPIDSGYSKHQKMRTELRELWGKERSFELFLTQAIKLLVLQN